jgi:hypothetical protein
MGFGDLTRRVAFEPRHDDSIVRMFQTGRATARIDLRIDGLDRIGLSPEWCPMPNLDLDGGSSKRIDWGRKSFVPVARPRTERSAPAEAPVRRSRSGYSRFSPSSAAIR